MIDNKIVWLDCNCHSPHHAIRIWHMHDEDFNELVIEMQVNNWRGFFRRCIEAFKYVFNFKNHKCGYDTFNLHSKDVETLKGIIDSFQYETKRREQEFQNEIQKQMPNVRQGV